MINSSAEVVPNMARKRKAPFGGKKAAPFAKGGGRKKNHPRTARGLLKKK